MQIRHGTRSYNDYIKSDKWRERREKHFASAKWKQSCFVCDSPVGLDVHHRTYERFENEADNDLVTLCRECHEEVHAEAKRMGTRFTDTHIINRRRRHEAEGATMPEEMHELGKYVAGVLFNARERLRHTEYKGAAAKIEDALQVLFGKPVPMDTENDKTLAK